VAECAGGLRALKYGVTRDYVLGVEAVLPTGEIIRSGGRLVRDVAGYDLRRLLCGSEGTLAVMTELTLRLVPAPQASGYGMAYFPSLADAARAVSRVLASGVMPVTLEFRSGACPQWWDSREAGRCPPADRAPGLVTPAQRAGRLARAARAAREGRRLCRAPERCRLLRRGGFLLGGARQGQRARPGPASRRDRRRGPGRDRRRQRRLLPAARAGHQAPQAEDAGGPHRRVAGRRKRSRCEPEAAGTAECDVAAHHPPNGRAEITPATLAKEVHSGLETAPKSPAHPR
jgi:FAD/FMN-containing dehydrogenase